MRASSDKVGVGRSSENQGGGGLVQLKQVGLGTEEGENQEEEDEEEDEDGGGGGGGGQEEEEGGKGEEEAEEGKGEEGGGAAQARPRSVIRWVRAQRRGGRPPVCFVFAVPSVRFLSFQQASHEQTPS